MTAAEGGPIEGPIGDATVTAFDAAGEPAGSDTTAANGTYEIDGLDAGTYEVTATADSFEGGTRDVTVTAGATTTEDFALTATPPRATSITLEPLEAEQSPAGDPHTLTATVRDQYEDAFPDAGVRFVVDEEGDPAPGTGPDVTDSDGEATFTFTNNTADATNQITACTTGDSIAPADCDGEVLRVEDPATKTWGLARVRIEFAQSRSDDPNRVILVYTAPLDEPNGDLDGVESQFTLETETTIVTATSVRKVDGQHVHVSFPSTVAPGQTIRYEAGSAPIRATDGRDVRSPDAVLIAAQPLVRISEPTQGNPAAVGPGDTLEIVFTTDIAGEYRLEFRLLDSAGFTLFSNGRGTAVADDPNRVQVTVPDDANGTYDIRARVTSDEDHTGQRIEREALTVTPPASP